MIKKKHKEVLSISEFRRLYDLHYSSLCAFLNFYTQDKDLVLDTVQDVFLSLWENRDAVDLKAGIKTYLFKVGKNKMLNHLRNENNRYSLLEQWYEHEISLANSSSNTFEVERLYAELQNAIDNLPPKCKDIFVLNKMQSITYKDIADKKSISIKTVENQMGIALKKIREHMINILKTFLIFICFGL